MRASRGTDPTPQRRHGSGETNEYAILSCTVRVMFCDGTTVLYRYCRLENFEPYTRLENFEPYPRLEVHRAL